MLMLVERYQGKVAKYKVTEIPLVTGLEYDQWKFVNKDNAELLSKTDGWSIEDELGNVIEVKENTEMKKWLLLLLSYLPTILATVVAVENASSGLNVPGANKKQVVLDIITAGAKGVEQIPNETVAGIGTVIDTVVGAFNKSGIFTTKTTPTG
jgi:hypothetical protein